MDAGAFPSGEPFPRPGPAEPERRLLIVYVLKPFRRTKPWIEGSVAVALHAESLMAARDSVAPGILEHQSNEERKAVVRSGAPANAQAVARWTRQGGQLR